MAKSSYDVKTDTFTCEDCKEVLTSTQYVSGNHICRANDKKASDLINHPPHYTAHPSGIECITITEHMGFNLGNAVKYIWRADLKHDALEDLRKARWYLDREIAKRASTGAIKDTNT